MAPYCDVYWYRFAGQERSGERCVYSNRSAQQDSPEHTGETHLSPSQVKQRHAVLPYNILLSFIVLLLHNRVACA